MKKFATALFTLVLVFCCVLGFAACEDEDNTGENGDNEPATTTYEVTAEEWESILGGTFDNFTAVSISPNGEILINKMGGDKIYINMGYEYKDGQYVSIYVKEGDEYFIYVFENSVWTKYDLEEYVYLSAAMSVQLFNQFKDDYSEFTYSDGKYTCDSLDKTENTVFYAIVENIEINFEDGKLLGMVFDREGYKYELKDFGATTIELPTEYIDNTSSN